jgi:hypothetical protein
VRRLLPALLGGLLLALAPAAQATTETASSGTVSARLSYTKEGELHYTGLRLTVARAGRSAYDAPVPSSCTDPDCGFSPGGLGKTPSLRVADLNRDGDPEVVVQLYSGGAHCCTFAEVYAYSTSLGTYVENERDFGGGGYALLDLNHDGAPDFRGADPRFDEAFTAHAASTEPVQILDFENGGFTDVTRRFPGAIKGDARALLRFYRRERRAQDGDVRGILASYAADEYLLGRKSHALAVLSAARHHGELNRPASSGFATGRAYLKRLKRLLAKYGYAS